MAVLTEVSRQAFANERASGGDEFIQLGHGLGFITTG